MVSIKGDTSPPLVLTNLSLPDTFANCSLPAKDPWKHTKKQKISIVHCPHKENVFEKSSKLNESEKSLPWSYKRISLKYILIEVRTYFEIPPKQSPASHFPVQVSFSPLHYEQNRPSKLSSFSWKSFETDQIFSSLMPPQNQ